MKLINNKLVEETAEDLAQVKIDKANFIAKETAKAKAKTAQDNLKTSATNKLKALGLTDAEIEAL
jgi:hypothetical protein